MPRVTSASSISETRSNPRDWVSSAWSYAIAWGAPTIGLISSVFFEHPTRTMIWTIALVWMGTACLINAHRCGRRHCYLTGPFFLFLAVLGVFHGYKFIWLGSYGWTFLWISLVVIGGGVLWYLPEKIWGKYRKVT